MIRTSDLINTLWQRANIKDRKTLTAIAWLDEQTSLEIANLAVAFEAFINKNATMFDEFNEQSATQKRNHLDVGYLLADQAHTIAATNSIIHYAKIKLAEPILYGVTESEGA